MLISFRIDWVDLLAVQGTLKKLLQHHMSKASILWCSAFFLVQLSNSHKTNGKTIALAIWTVGKVMSLLLNAVKVCHCFPFKEQVSFNFMTAVTIHSDYGAKKIKSVTASTFSPSTCHEVMGPDVMILVF